MGDMGDLYNDLREYRRAQRQHWQECPTCKVRFGTGTKVAPGRKCRNCAWIAPGDVGSDIAAADQAMTEQCAAGEAREESQRLKRAARTPCPICKRWLANGAAVQQHLKTAHRKRLKMTGGAQ